MSELSPTLNLVVTADAKGITEIGEALTLLKKALGEVSGSTSEASAAATAHSRDMEKTAQEHNNKMLEIAAKGSANSLKNMVTEYDTSLGFTKAHVAALLREAENSTLYLEAEQRKASQERRAAQVSGNLLQITEEHRMEQERRAARAAGNLLQITEEHSMAQERRAAQVSGNLLQITEEHRMEQERRAARAAGNLLQITEEYKMGQEHEAMLIKRAEMDVAYGQMELSRQIKLRKELAAVQANPTLGAAYAEAKFAPAAIADVRPIKEMEAALLGVKKGAAGAAGTFGTLNGAMREGHSLARGLLGPLNAMWLSWGSLVPLLAGAAISASIAGSIKAGSDFEVVLSRIQGISGETKGAVKEAGEAFKDMAKNSLFGAKDVATGAQILVAAGLSLGESLKALPTVMQLASVGELNLSNAAAIATGTMNAFGLAISDIPGIANVLSKAADISQTNIAEMGEAMKQASTVAKAYKVSVVEMSAGIASLAQIHITGGAAGTAYKNMLDNLVTPSAKGAKELQTLGVSAFDASGQLKNIRGTFDELSTAISKLTTDTEKATAISEIFTQRGARGYRAYAEAIASGKLDEYIVQLKEVAATQAYLNTKQEVLNNTVGKQAEMAFNSLGVAMINAFDSSSSGLLALTKRLKEFIQSAQFGEGLKSVVTGFVTLANALVDLIPLVEHVGAALIILQGLALAAEFAAWAAPLLATATATGVLTGAVVALEAVVWPIGIAIVAVAATWYLFTEKTNSALDEADKRIQKSADRLATILRDGNSKQTIEDANEALHVADTRLKMARDVQAAHENANKSALTWGITDPFKVKNKAADAEEDSKRVIKAVEERNAAMKAVDASDEARYRGNAQIALSEGKLINGVKPASSEVTNFKTHTVDTKAENARAQINAASNRAFEESYNNALRNAKRLESVSADQAKQDLDAHVITLQEYQKRTNTAAETYAAEALRQEDTLFKNLRSSQKSGHEALDKINLESKKRRISDNLEADKADLQAQIDHDVRAAGIAQKAASAKASARLAELNSQAAQNRENTQDVFDNRFNTPVNIAGAKASLAAEKPFQAEIDAQQKLLDIEEERARIKPREVTEDARILDLRKQIALLELAKVKTGELAAVQAEANKKISETWQSGATQAVKEYTDKAQNSAQLTHDIITKAFSGMETALSNFVTTGKLDFRSFASSIIADLIKIQLQEALTQSLKLLSGAGGLSGLFGESNGGVLGGGSGLFGMLSNFFTPSAKGNAFNSGSLTAFASGGAFTNQIVNSPTRFPMGLMGEAGPEAIMPLTRDSSGRLGVTASGGSQGKSGVHATQPVASTQPAPSNNSIRIVNVMDPSVVGDYFNSSAGEKVLINMMRKNASAIQDISRG